MLEIAVGSAAIHAARRGTDARQSAEFAFADVVGEMFASGEQFPFAYCEQFGEAGKDFGSLLFKKSNLFILRLFFVFIQGMYTQSAEQLWKKITEHVSDNKYSIKQTILGLDSFIKTFQISKKLFNIHI